MGSGFEDNKKKLLSWQTAQMSPRAAAYYAKFLKRYREKAEQAQSTPLAVLIWGPGSADGELYQKRQQIKGILLLKGDAAVFSEEIDAECGDFNISCNVREFLQAKCSDFVIVLYGTPGSIAEVHDFAANKDIGPKMLIFIDQRHIGGYGYKGALKQLAGSYNNVHTYKFPDDIRDCHLIGKVEEHLRVLRWAKWLAHRRSN